MEKNKKRIVAFLTSLLALFIFASCTGKKGPEPGATDIIDVTPTERPTEVPMRDISNDTPLADTLLYANRIANEVQAYNTLPNRTKFTVQNSNARRSQMREAFRISEIITESRISPSQWICT